MSTAAYPLPAAKDAEQRPTPLYGRLFTGAARHTKGSAQDEAPDGVRRKPERPTNSRCPARGRQVGFDPILSTFGLVLLDYSAPPPDSAQSSEEFDVAPACLVAGAGDEDWHQIGVGRAREAAGRDNGGELIGGTLS
jgi:hypothetical protein